MVLRFDLFEEPVGQPPSFDGQAMFPLAAKAPSISRTVEQCIDLPFVS